ncbi:MAG: NAD(P)-binding protein [Chitinophagaceae bacterium]
MLQEKKEVFDYIVMGSGFGGLVCAALLAKEGYTVCVLEKNKQLGGALQSFGIEKKLFDAAVHYLGSLDEGKTLNKIFKYLHLDQVQKYKLNQFAFDEIVIGQKRFALAQGFELYQKQLIEKFPHEEQGIIAFIQYMQQTVQDFPLYSLSFAQANKSKHVSISLKTVVENFIQDELLRNILMGNNILYAGHYDTLPFYVHALISCSYIEGSYKFSQGSASLIKAIEKTIVTHRGLIKRNIEIKKIVAPKDQVVYIEDQNGTQYKAQNYISNFHPLETYKITTSPLLKKITTKRFEEAQNTISCFMINLVLKEKLIVFQNTNSYFHKTQDVWRDTKMYDIEDINSFAVYYNEDEKNKGYCDSMTILIYMPFSYFEKWESTYRTTSFPKQRNDEYEIFKTTLVQNIIRQIEDWFPNLSQNIVKADACTPLSYRDYLHTPQGSFYGIEKNINDFINSSISTKTKIPNLFLTGQNMNLHGVLGVSLSAILTASNFIPLEQLLKKINTCS